MIARCAALAAATVVLAGCGSGSAGSGSTAPSEPGDAARGAAVFAASCSACHDRGIGTPLARSGVTTAAARAAIDDGTGDGKMPGGLVSGQAEADVLAYLARVTPRSR